MKRLISIALGACLLPGATAQASEKQRCRLTTHRPKDACARMAAPVAQKTVGQSSTTSQAARYNGTIPMLAGH
jgi:hypothetical protein